MSILTSTALEEHWEKFEGHLGGGGRMVNSNEFDYKFRVFFRRKASLV